VRFAWACGWVLLAIVFAASGAGLLLWSLYQALANAFGGPAAGAITGLLALLGAGVCAWIAQRISR